MKENEQLNEEFNESIDMEQAADSAFDEIKPGVIVQGEVVTTDKEYVYVNVGSKYEGRVPKEDFDELPQVFLLLQGVVKHRTACINFPLRRQ